MASEIEKKQTKMKIYFQYFSWFQAIIKELLLIDHFLRQAQYAE